MQLILIGRNERNRRFVADKICRIHGKDRAAFKQTDITDFAEVRKAATQIIKKYPRIDVLVNNAGARFNDFKSNGDGIELTFATNHLGHFLLTDLMLEPLKVSPAGRIITVRPMRIVDTVPISIKF
jgi:NAD(P)-dependent dehydrogenase (short-subunit alcohol dehydrogenase family)